jgi:serine/threonine-protein kinase
LVRFEREVEATSRLTHPNTVEVYDYGRTAAGVFYYAMEYLPGTTLAALVKQFGPQPPARVVHLLLQVCGSLYEAHRLGLIHRDIKPENLILCERGGMFDVVKVVDFGLAKDLRQLDEPSLTGTHTVVGTPRYLAPEALGKSGRVDARSDLYSLGAVGYFLLTERPPFSGSNIVEISIEQLNTTPKRPSAVLGRPVPRDLEEILLACLERDPARRPTTAHTLQRSLAECEDAGKWTPKIAAAWWKENLPQAVRKLFL